MEGQPLSEIKRLRAQFVRPHVDSLFSWVEHQLAVFASYTRDALAYARNQRDTLSA